jgi:hypothetical protein
MAAVITTDEVKIFLQITDTSKDDLIDALIPIVQDNIIEYCNDDFTTNSVQSFPVGLKLVASQMIGYDMSIMSGGGGSIGMQSESQGEYSYSRYSSNSGIAGEYPASILASLNKWRKTRIHFGSVMQSSRDRRGLTIKQLADNKYIAGVENELIYDTDENGVPVIVP